MRTPYVSPRDRALATLKRIQEEGRESVPRREAAVAFRIARRLMLTVIDDLEKAEAPFKIVRWVAWGKGKTAGRERADLVLHLRRTLQTPNGGWHREPQLRAALQVWQRAVDEARRRGLIQPRPEDLPIEVYETAVASVTRSTRRSPTTSKARAWPQPILLTKEEREALAVLPVLQRLLQRTAQGSELHGGR